MNPKNGEYIKRIDAKRALTALSADLDAETVQRCVEAMNNPKAADVEPKRSSGWWIEQDSWGDTYYTCSVCKGDFVTLDGESPEENEIHFCPMCGAKMDAEPPKE
jgi:DNA-directed RNA polymerase subunit RPC12/RpoP